MSEFILALGFGLGWWCRGYRKEIVAFGMKTKNAVVAVGLAARQQLLDLLGAGNSTSAPKQSQQQQKPTPQPQPPKRTGSLL